MTTVGSCKPSQSRHLVSAIMLDTNHSYCSPPRLRWIVPCGITSILFPANKTRSISGKRDNTEDLTPELRLPTGGRIKLPSLSFRMPSEDDRVMADFLRDKMHPRILKCLRKQWVARPWIRKASTSQKYNITHKPFRPVRCRVFAYVETANAAT